MEPGCKQVQLGFGYLFIFIFFRDIARSFKKQSYKVSRPSQYRLFFQKQLMLLSGFSRFLFVKGCLYSFILIWELEFASHICSSRQLLYISEKSLFYHLIMHAWLLCFKLVWKYIQARKKGGKKKRQQETCHKLQNN